MDEYFEGIFADFEGENKKLDDLMNLFDHYADNNKIKLKINGMESNLGALN